MGWGVGGGGGLGGGHEDWRRRGGMVVWCLDEGEKRAWRDGERDWEEIGGWKGFVGKMKRRWWS